MIHVSEILPHSACSLIRTVEDKLKIYRVINQFAIESIEAIDHFGGDYLKKNYDSLVGETLCQTRAYSNLLYRKKSHTETLMQYRDRLLDLISRSNLEAKIYQDINLAKKKHQIEKEDNSNTLSNLLKCSNFTFSESNTIFLILSYILSKYGVANCSNIPERLNYEKISENYQLSKSYSKKFAHNLQRLLSELSTKKILELNADLKFNTNLSTFSYALTKVSDENRVVLPCFNVSEVVLRHALENGHEIALQIHFQKLNKTLIFAGAPNAEKIDFEIKPLDENVKNKTYLVFSGTSSNTSENSLLGSIGRLGVLNMILANQAQHPQYSGIRLKAYRDAPYRDLILHYNSMGPQERAEFQQLNNRFEQYKGLALREGCWIENNELFLIQHIYFSTGTEIILNLRLEPWQREKNQSQQLSTLGESWIKYQEISTGRT